MSILALTFDGGIDLAPFAGRQSWWYSKRGHVKSTAQKRSDDNPINGGSSFETAQQLSPLYCCTVYTPPSHDVCQRTGPSFHVSG